MIQEFKDFINKGDIVDLAVAVVMATAFKPIVDTFVNGVLMQIVAAIFGEPNFDQLSFGLGDAEIFYGTVITANQNFLDIFHHRLGMLFYRIWADAEPAGDAVATHPIKTRPNTGMPK